MKVDKINTEYRASPIVTGDKYIKPFKLGSKVSVPTKRVEIDITNEILDIHSNQSMIVETLKVDQTFQKIDETYLRFIKGMVQGKSQLVIESIIVKSDNSLDIFLKDGNILSIRNMEELITPKEAKELINNLGSNQSVKEVNIKLFDKDNSVILINGQGSKEESYKTSILKQNVNTIMSELIAIEKLSKCIVIFSPALGFIYLDNHLLKRIIYNLPYLSNLHEYSNYYYFFRMLRKYTWQIIFVLILALLAFIKQY